MPMLAFAPGNHVRSQRRIQNGDGQTEVKTKIEYDHFPECGCGEDEGRSKVTYSAMPAELMRTSGAPYVSTTALTASLIAFSSRTSTLKNWTGTELPVSWWSSAAEISPSSWLASKMIIALAPASTQALAM